MDQKPAAVLTIHVQPRARRTEVVGWQGDAIKVRLAAVPANGKANDALLAYMAEALSVPRHAVRLLSGATGRRKRVEVRGLSVNEALKRLGLR